MNTAQQSDTPFLVLGACGQLGRACAALLGDEAVALTYEQLDISDRSSLQAAIEQWGPRVIINCAAATDVDRCEVDHEYADSANWGGPRYLAELAAEHAARLVHVSTDFVFAGEKATPYAETDPPHPLNYYGLSKLRGEEAVLSACSGALVIRTSWLFGEGAANFPHKVLKWAARGEPLRVAVDQRGNPTYAVDLAVGIEALTRQDATGLYHLAGTGCASRFELAAEVVRIAGLPVAVHPARAADFPLPAPRPPQSCLDCSKAAVLGVVMPTWRDGLIRFLADTDTICANSQAQRGFIR